MKASYRFSHLVLNKLFNTFFKWEVNARENLPSDGGVIVVANHLSNFDPPILGAALDRKINYMAKEELFSNFFMRKILQHFDAFPVKRGKADMGAIKTALKLLKNDKLLGLFPEGTRGKPGKLKRAKAGIVLIATKAEVPIVPVGLIGTQSPFKEELKINIGKAFKLEDFYGRKLAKKELRTAGKLIMDKIALELKK